MCNITGQLPMEGINMNISAVNCDGQEGPANTTTVFPKGRYVIKTYSVVALVYTGALAN